MPKSLELAPDSKMEVVPDSEMEVVPESVTLETELAGARARRRCARGHLVHNTRSEWNRAHSRLSLRLLAAENALVVSCSGSRGIHTRHALQLQRV